ncbi:MAG: dTDP-4-dehydrorhamnose reductase [Glaciecola sp.]|jgi:dTDP-4-dehydrorhamnose reductase
MTIVIIGKNGQLANEFKLLDTKLVCLGREEINVFQFNSMQETLKRYSPSVIINASAYTAVDKAESDKDAAFMLNHLAVKNLAEYSVQNSAHLVHVSTDYVFAGDKGSPYLVDEVYAPGSVYGASKVAGERAIIETGADNSCIIRTSWVYSQFGNNFVKTMLRLLDEKTELAVIDDQIGTPTSASALAQACLYAAQYNVTGIHHFTDAGVASWYDFAVAIQRIGLEQGLLSRRIPINPIPTSEYLTVAKRPSYSVLDKSTLKTSFNNMQPRHWQTELASVIDSLKHQQMN